METEGDPKLYETGAGPILSINGGQPEMNEGLENAVYLSIFTDSGYWGNVLADTPEKFSSNFGEIYRRTLNNQTRIDAEKYASASLAWIVSSGIAKSVAVSASIPGIGILGLIVIIEQPNKTVTLKYQINWSTMAVRVGAA